MSATGRPGREGAPVIEAPVITVDGPAASGKGTVAAGVARALGFHLLDSGALYRLVALEALDRGIDPDDEAKLTPVATAPAGDVRRGIGAPRRSRRHRGDPPRGRRRRRVAGRRPPRA